MKIVITYNEAWCWPRAYYDTYMGGPVTVGCGRVWVTLPWLHIDPKRNY